jgi:hypothetical protein
LDPQDALLLMMNSSVAVGRAVVEPPVKPADGDAMHNRIVPVELVPSREIRSWKFEEIPVCFKTIQECATPAAAHTRSVLESQRSTASRPDATESEDPTTVQGFRPNPLRVFLRRRRRVRLFVRIVPESGTVWFTPYCQVLDRTGRAI